MAAPSTPADAYGLLLAAIDDPDPVIFIENLPTYFMGEAGERPPKGERVPLGKAKITHAGNDVTIVSYSRMAREAQAAAEMLAGEGISAEVIDLRTVSPWDRSTVLESVSKTGRLLVVHEAVKPFGVGAEIAADIGRALFGKLKAPIERIGAAFSPVPFTKPLETAHVPDRSRIAAATRELVNGSQP